MAVVMNCQKEYFLIIVLLVMPWLAIPSVSAADKVWVCLRLPITYFETVAVEPDVMICMSPPPARGVRFAYDKRENGSFINERAVGRWFWSVAGTIKATGMASI